MLHVDPMQRYTAAQVLQHQWITSRAALPNSKLLIKDSKIKVSLLVPPPPLSHSLSLSLPSLPQGAMKATFDALSRPPTAQLDPVDNSTLAQRRRNKKSSTS